MNTKEALKQARERWESWSDQERADHLAPSLLMVDGRRYHLDAMYESGMAMRVRDNGELIERISIREITGEVAFISFGTFDTDDAIRNGWVCTD